MLTHPTLEKLGAMKLHGMAKALQEQLASPGYTELSFEERFGLLVDREGTERENRRLTSRLKQARLRQCACMEDIDYSHSRGLDKPLMKSLAACTWIKEHLNLLMSGPTGSGKSFLACALGHRACLQGFKVLYFRASRLFQSLALGRGEGTYSKLMNAMARTNLVILDDWGLSPLNEQEQRDFLEILEDRHGLHSTIIASQLPVDH